MALTYEPIATNTLGSNTATVTFNSISGSYTDLILVMTITGTEGGQSVYFRFNGDTGTNYSSTRMAGTGSSGVTTRHTQQTFGSVSRTATTSSDPAYNAILHLFNYSNTIIWKNAISRANQTEPGTELCVNLWRNTSAITSLTILPSGASTFQTGSTFNLYGVKAA